MTARFGYLYVSTADGTKILQHQLRVQRAKLVNFLNLIVAKTGVLARAIIGTYTQPLPGWQDGNSMAKFLISHLREIFSRLTAGVVALPLALAFGEASGAVIFRRLRRDYRRIFCRVVWRHTLTNLGTNGADDCCLRVLPRWWDHLAGIRHGSTRRDHSGAFGVLGLDVHQTGSLHRGIGLYGGIGYIIVALQLARLLAMNPLVAAPPALLEVPNAVTNLGKHGRWPVALAIVFRWPAKWGRYLPGPLAALARGDVCQLGLEHRAGAGIFWVFPNLLCPPSQAIHC